MTVDQKETLPLLKITPDGKLHVEWRLMPVNAEASIHPAIALSVNGILARFAAVHDAWKNHAYANLLALLYANQKNFRAKVMISDNDGRMTAAPPIYPNDAQLIAWAMQRKKVQIYIDLDIANTAESPKEFIVALKGAQSCRSFQTMSANGLFSDLEIVASDGRIFHCHRIIVASSSPVLMQMLTSGMKESQSNRINFPTISSKVIDTFLKLAYGAEANISTEDFQELVDFTVMYEIDSVKEAICDWIKSVDVSLLPDQFVAQVLANWPKISELPNGGNCYITGTFLNHGNQQLTSWMFQGWFKLLTLDDIAAIFSTLAITDAGNTSINGKIMDPWAWFHFEAIRTWIEAQVDEEFDADAYSNLIRQSIDFQTMTYTQLAVVAKQPVLKKLPAIAYLVMDALADWQ